MAAGDGEAARGQASLWRRLQSSEEAQQRQAVLVRKLQEKVRGAAGSCPGSGWPGGSRGGASAGVRASSLGLGRGPGAALLRPSWPRCRGELPGEPVPGGHPGLSSVNHGPAARERPGLP